MWTNAKTPATRGAPARARRALWLVALALATLLLAGCGGGGGNGAADGGADRATTDAGLPVSQPTGAVDEALAEKGERLFRTRGCVACHTLGQGRKVGPDLKGVTERRTFRWMYHMVLNPDSMVKHDPAAKQLLGEYYTPMSDQNVQPEQFRAIYEYLRSEGAAEETDDGGGPGAGEAEEAASASVPATPGEGASSG